MRRRGNADQVERLRCNPMYDELRLQDRDEELAPRSGDRLRLLLP